MNRSGEDAVCGGLAGVAFDPVVLSSPFDEAIVFGVRPDPDPEDALLFAGGIHADCAIVNTRPNGPGVADLLEMQRRMLGVGLEQAEVFVGRPLNISGQTLVERPEIGTGKVAQRRLHLPALKSARAFSIRSRNGPDF